MFMLTGKEESYTIPQPGNTPECWIHNTSIKGQIGSQVLSFPGFLHFLNI